MKLPQPEPRRQEESLIPLINIVFLLLIFFMIAGTLSRPELFGVEPPRSRSAVVPEPEATSVLLGVDGRMALDGEAITPERLTGVLRTRRLEQPEAPLHLKADAQVPAERLHEVMALLRDAGVEKFRLLTVQER